MTNRQRLCLAIVATMFILALGGGALFALVKITDNRPTISGTTK